MPKDRIRHIPLSPPGRPRWFDFASIVIAVLGVVLVSSWPTSQKIAAIAAISAGVFLLPWVVSTVFRLSLRAYFYDRVYREVARYRASEGELKEQVDGLKSDLATTSESLAEKCVELAEMEQILADAGKKDLALRRWLPDSRFERVAMDGGRVIVTIRVPPRIQLFSGDVVGLLWAADLTVLGSLAVVGRTAVEEIYSAVVRQMSEHEWWTNLTLHASGDQAVPVGAILELPINEPRRQP